VRRSAHTLTRLAIIGGLLTPFIASVPASADVSQCAPITIDGQEAACLALSSTPITDSDGDPGLQVSFTLAVSGRQPVTQSQTVVIPVFGNAKNFCSPMGVVAHPFWFQGGQGPSDAFVYGIGHVSSPACFGTFGLAMSPNAEADVTPPALSTHDQVVSVPYHVPQICLTTSPNACVGPYDGSIDETVPVPTVDSPPGASIGYPVQLCILGASSAYPFWFQMESDGTGLVPDGYYDASACLPYVPVGTPNPVGI
jgi:hypothetical protein